MDLVALIRLIAAHPDKAASIIFNLNKNGYYTEFNDYLNLCHLLKYDDEIISKNINDIVVKALNQNEKQSNIARDLIKAKVSEILGILYERTDKLIPRKSFEGYVLLVFDKPEAELKEYEDLAFNYDGQRIVAPEMRIYDALNDIRHYLNDEMGQAAGYKPEQIAFIRQTEQEIIEMLNEGNVEGAKYKLVALQLYLDIGTKFRKELKEFVLRPLNLREYLNIAVDKSKGGPTR